MIRESAVVRVEAGGKPGRPGVVLRLIDRDGRQFAFVPWGTGTLRPDRRHVAVNHREAAGIALELEKPTYFYPGNVWIGPADLLEPRRAGCPPELMKALRALFGLR
jgi:hypothetical protein